MNDKTLIMTWLSMNSIQQALYTYSWKVFMLTKLGSRWLIWEQMSRLRSLLRVLSFSLAEMQTSISKSMPICCVKDMLQGSQVVSSIFSRDHRERTFCLRNGLISYRLVVKKELNLNRKQSRKHNKKKLIQVAWQISSLPNIWLNLTRLWMTKKCGRKRIRKSLKKLISNQCSIK